MSSTDVQPQKQTQNKQQKKILHNLISGTDQDGHHYVFDADHSEMRTVVGHTVSFVLPQWLTTLENGHNFLSEGFETTLLHGQVVHMEFDLDGDDIEAPVLNKKGFCIHGVYYPLDADLAQIQKDGVEAARLYSVNGDIVIPGGEPFLPARVLCLSKIHVQIAKKHRSSAANLEKVMETIRSTTGRNVQIIGPAKNNVISIPIQWVVQDETAVADYNKRSPRSPIKEIKTASAFPSIGTRIVFNQDNGDGNNEEKVGFVEDFGVREDGSTVQVLVSELGDKESFVPISYSTLYPGPGQQELFPEIIRTITVEAMKNIRKTYLQDSRDHIFREMKKWSLFEVPRKDERKAEGGNMQVFALETVHGGDRSDVVSDDPNGGQNETQAVISDDEKKGRFRPKPKNRWIAPEDVIESSHLNIASFEGGTAIIDGVKRRITYREELSNDNNELTIDLHDIPSIRNIISLVFNAVMGTAKKVKTFNEKMSDEKEAYPFFSTYNGVDITTRRVPLFSSITPTERVTVDVASFHKARILGYIGKSHQEGHEDKDVLYWSRVPEAFYNFYLFVVSKGADKIFKGKTISEVRDMFVSEDFPTLVEIYNFMIYGVEETNTTRESKWTEFFITSCLGVSRSDLE